MATLSICEVNHTDPCGVPSVFICADTFPITPLMAVSSLVTIFNIAPTPSASYFAPGSVITSMRLIIDAGIADNTSLGLLENELFGRPFLYTLKLLEPFTVILFCASTFTIGTLRSISMIVDVFELSSACTSYPMRSISFVTRGRCANTVTSPNISELSFITNLPKSAIGVLLFTENSRSNSCRPTEETDNKYSPSDFNV